MKFNLTFSNYFSFSCFFSFFLKVILVLFSLLSLWSFKLLAYDDKHAHNPSFDEMVIMTSIEPLAALVQSVVADLTKVESLLDAGGNLHTHIIKISDIRKIRNTHLFFTIHPNMETALHKVLINQDEVHHYPLFNGKDSNHQVKGASEYLNLQLAQLKQQELEAKVKYDSNVKSHHQNHKDEHKDEYDDESDSEHNHSQEHGSHSLIDYHIWLDPIYAKVMLDKIAQILGKHYPTHKATFIKNADLAKQEIDETNQKIRSELTELQDKAFLVYHDAYQYFVNHYDLNQVGYIATETGSLSAKKIMALREIIDRESVSCLFSEKQYFDAKKTIEMITEEIEEDKKLNIKLINPTYAPESYSNFLLNLSVSFQSCLQS